MASNNCCILSACRVLGLTPFVLAGVALAALWTFGLSARGDVPVPGEVQSDSPLAKGRTLWDSFPSAAARPQAPRPTQDATETEVRLQDWEYTSTPRPVSHWRR
jgi:hypothetical protein